jgi:hypothetical protein
MRVCRFAGPLATLDEAARLRLLGLIAAVLAVCAAIASRGLWIASYDTYTFAVLAHGTFYCAAAWVVLTVGLGKRALLMVLAVAALLRALAFVVPVGLTTDGYRYVWDGRLQAAGINPYLTVPADPRLEKLRDVAIYPNINGKESYPTIYPALAQISFLIGTRIHDSIEGLKALMALVEAGIIWALVAWLRVRGLPRERVLIYAWHPLPLWEFTGHGHIDAVAVLCVVLGLLAADRGRMGWSGAAFAGAALVKYWPVYLAAAAWRRWDWRMLAGGLATGTLLYTPYVWPQIIGLGFTGLPPEKLIGSLFKHLNAEGYNEEGWGFFIAYASQQFGLWNISGATYGKMAGLGLLILGVAIALRQKRGLIEGRHLILLMGTFLLAISPHYPWYYAMAVPLLTVSFYPPLAWVTLAISALYIEWDYNWLVPYPRFKVYLILYAGFVILAATTWWFQRRRS